MTVHESSYLTVNCINCNTTYKFWWEFFKNFTLSCSKCMKCSDEYQLLIPDTLNKNIIQNENELPPKYWKFSYDKEEDEFLVELPVPKDIEYPVLYLNKHISHFYDCWEYGIVAFSDIEKYITNNPMNYITNNSILSD